VRPTIAVVRLAHGADLPLPAYESAGAAGMDLRAAVDSPLVLAPGARAAVPTGLAMALPPGFEGQVRPRSGFALRDGVTTLNTPGTIDSDYRGEVKVILINHGAEASAAATASPSWSWRRSPSPFGRRSKVSTKRRAAPAASGRPAPVRSHSQACAEWECRRSTESLQSRRECPNLTPSGRWESPLKGQMPMSASDGGLNR